jgi:hypothetical protein
VSRYNRHRRDTNHREIVDRLRELGCSVRDLSQVGDHLGDIEIGLMGRDYGAEIKTPGEGLSYEQSEAHMAWRGSKPIVFWSVDQAVAWVADERTRIIKGLS